ncbi:MAG: ECF transporter S component [Oscillospiraceae bacterium]|nr:ECF transporter S component [Oscillospiraceae bacterium]
MKTHRIAADAMLVAMYFLLSNYFAVNLGSIRLTLDILPIIVGASLFGPIDGLIIGLLGNFLFQLIGPYGISVTTVLWMLPDGLRGLLTGLFLKNINCVSKVRCVAVLGLISLAATALTTGVMYIDCLVFKYSFAVYTPFILWRCIAGLVISALIAFVLPRLNRALEHIFKKSGGANT